MIPFQPKLCSSALYYDTNYLKCLSTQGASLLYAETQSDDSISSDDGLHTIHENSSNHSNTPKRTISFDASYIEDSVSTAVEESVAGSEVGIHKDFKPCEQSRYPLLGYPMSSLTASDPENSLEKLLSTANPCSREPSPIEILKGIHCSKSIQMDGDLTIPYKDASRILILHSCSKSIDDYGMIRYYFTLDAVNPSDYSSLAIVAVFFDLRHACDAFRSFHSINPFGFVSACFGDPELFCVWGLGSYLTPFGSLLDNQGSLLVIVTGKADVINEWFMNFLLSFGQIQSIRRAHELDSKFTDPHVTFGRVVAYFDIRSAYAALKSSGMLVKYDSRVFISLFRTHAKNSDAALPPCMNEQPKPQSNPSYFQIPLIQRKNHKITQCKVLRPMLHSSGNSSSVTETDLWNICDGRDKRTTFMIKNIPNKYSQELLIELLDRHHQGCYDFLYLRIDFVNKCNVGYAFINFCDSSAIISFTRMYKGSKWDHFDSAKVCDIAFANLQGRDALIEKFRNSSVMLENPSYRPKLFYSWGPSKGLEEPFPPPTQPLRSKSSFLFSRDRSKNEDLPDIQQADPLSNPLNKDDDDDDDKSKSDVTTLMDNQPVKSTSSSSLPSQSQPISKSQKIGSLQTIFTDSQKIAYVGLCYLSIHLHKTIRLKNQTKARRCYEEWGKLLLETLYAYIGVSLEEQLMMQQLAEHGLTPMDLAKSLMDDAVKAATQFRDEEMRHQREEREALENGQPLPNPTNDDASDPQTITPIPAEADVPSDIRYTVLSHLFILCIADGCYDSRERCLMRTVAKYLSIPWTDVIQLEINIAEQLRVHEYLTNLRQDEATVGQRNVKESKGRWLFMGLATLAGGAVIGLTAGLAAPLIGAGIATALGGLGVSGAAGVSTFMGSATGLALITTGGVLTGGGMSGMKMLKRTRGISEFEFLPIEDAKKEIEENKKKRAEERQKRRRRRLYGGATDSSSALNSGSATPRGRQATQSSSTDLLKSSRASSSDSVELKKNMDAETGTVLWETSTIITDVNENESKSGVDNKTQETSNSEPVESDIPRLPAKSRQTNVLITIAGWITYGKDDFTLPFSTLLPNTYGDQYSLIWESKDLKNLGSALKILAGEIGSFLFQQGIQHTLLPVLMAGLTGPMWALKLTYLMDNPWGIGLSKAKKTGRALADMLIGQVQENRPVTLIGYSLGARVIYFCLLELAARGAYGIVEEAYIFGCPVMSNAKEWRAIASVVAGKIVNGYQHNDWVLGVLYRASSAAWAAVPGLGPVEGIPGVENVKLDDVINGHLEYRLGMPKILQTVGFEITADYFDDEDDEIERERLEVLEYKKKEQEEKARLKLEKIKMKQDQEERKKQERHRSTSGSGKTRIKEGKEIIQESDETDFDWMPKELASTMPPLIIESHYNKEHIQMSTSAQSLSSLEDDDVIDFEHFKPKELPSTLPTLVINPSDKKLFDQLDLKGKDLEAELLKYTSVENGGLGEKIMTSGPGDLADCTSLADGGDHSRSNTSLSFNEFSSSSESLAISVATQDISRMRISSAAPPSVPESSASALIKGPSADSRLSSAMDISDLPIPNASQKSTPLPPTPEENPWK